MLFKLTINSEIISLVQRTLQNECCSSGVEEYTVWKSFPSENGTQSLKPVALWADDAGGLIRMEPIDLQTITIRIAVLQYQPFIALNISDDGEIELEDCVLKEILQYVSGRLKFKYRLVLAPSNDWGTKVDKVWRGAIGMVIRGEADAIPYLTVTPNRFEVIEYTKPLSSVYYGLLIAFPEEPPRVLIFLRLYAKEVWLLLVGVGLLLSILLSWMQKTDTTARESRILSSFSRCSWVIFGALLQQGSTCLPVTTSGRVLMSTWWLAVLILTTTYSANLIAVLAFPGIKFVVKSLEDMVNHDSIKLVIKEGCPVLEDLQESDIELYERVRKTFLENPRRSKIMDTVEERCCAIDDVIAKKSVYIDDYNYLQWMVDEDYKKENRCRITIPPYEFSRMDLAVGLRRGSFLLPLLNQEIQLMKENGVLDHWYSKYTPNREECYQMEQVLPGQREVRVEDLQGPFFLLLFSFIAGLLTLIAETLYKKYSARCKRQISDRYSQSFRNTNPF
nr:ionotropic receptor 93a [Parasteatoda tepidariorum]